MYSEIWFKIGATALVLFVCFIALAMAVRNKSDDTYPHWIAVAGGLCLAILSMFLPASAIAWLWGF